MGTVLSAFSDYFPPFFDGPPVIKEVVMEQLGK